MTFLPTPAPSAVHAVDLRVVLALLVLVHPLLYAWAEWRLCRHRRRRRAVLAGLPGDVREVLGWAVTFCGTEILVYREAGGRLRAAGGDGPAEGSLLGWLVAEGFIADVTAVDAAGTGGGGDPGTALDF